ncbi:MAG: hypothetical protein RL180_1234 [Pseudomonadota bacterium]|jgi:uncharacterized protein (TIGR00369 family)
MIDEAGVSTNLSTPPVEHSDDGWTGSMAQAFTLGHDAILQRLSQAFNHSPFMAHSGMQMRVVNGQIEGHMDMAAHLVGNVAFRILHGGVAATLLDSIGGVVAMGEIYRRNDGERSEQMKKASRLATVDMRIDYLSPGRGQWFVATASVLRMGRKGCTMRMDLHNDEGRHIATGIASYAY